LVASIFVLERPLPHERTSLALVRAIIHWRTPLTLSTSASEI